MVEPMILLEAVEDIAKLAFIVAGLCGSGPKKARSAAEAEHQRSKS